MLVAIFSLDDLGELHSFMGIGAKRLPNGSLYLKHKNNILDILERAHMVGVKPVATLICTYVQ